MEHTDKTDRNRCANCAKAEGHTETDLFQGTRRCFSAGTEDGDLICTNFKEAEPAPMKKLSTIQKRENLNEVFRAGEPGPGGAYHDYVVSFVPGPPENDAEGVRVLFQEGARKSPGSRHGILDSDLLEIVRDRLRSFQAGEFSTEYNARALEHLEIALMYTNRRVEDRIERNVLGTMQK